MLVCFTSLPEPLGPEELGPEPKLATLPRTPRFEGMVLFDVARLCSRFSGFGRCLKGEGSERGDLVTGKVRILLVLLSSLILSFNSFFRRSARVCGLAETSEMRFALVRVRVFVTVLDMLMLLSV